MDELQRLVQQYDSYYEMSDDGATWRRGLSIDGRVRALARQLRAEGRGVEVDALMVANPNLISCPGGIHALA